MVIVMVTLRRGEESVLGITMIWHRKIGNIGGKGRDVDFRTVHTAPNAEVMKWAVISTERRLPSVVANPRPDHNMKRTYVIAVESLLYGFLTCYTTQTATRETSS